MRFVSTAGSIHNLEAEEGRPLFLSVHYAADERGCGALGHCNPESAKHTVHEFKEVLHHYGSSLEKVFGLDEEGLVDALLEAGFVNHASNYLRQSMARAARNGRPVIGALYNHATGEVKIVLPEKTRVGTLLSEFRENGFDDVACSDARVKHVGALVLKALDEDANARSISVPPLSREEAAGQKPGILLIHSPYVKPDKLSGRGAYRGNRFAVSAQENAGLDFAARVSAVYALLSFVKNGGSLKRVEFAGADAKEKELLKKNFAAEELGHVFAKAGVKIG